MPEPKLREDPCRNTQNTENTLYRFAGSWLEDVGQFTEWQITEYRLQGVVSGRAQGVQIQNTVYRFAGWALGEEER